MIRSKPRAMLKQRILTAVILVPLLVAALFYLSLPWLTLIFAVVMAAAAWEWAGLTGLRHFAAKLAYVTGFAAVRCVGTEAHTASP